MAIIDVTLKMGFSSKSLATIWVRAFVVFGMISLMVSVKSQYADSCESATMNSLQLVWLIEHLITTRLITCMYTILG